MRRLPKFLRIGGLKVGILVEHQLLHENPGDDHGHRAYGVFDPSIPLIWLDKDSGSERQKVTLVHEAMHVFLNTARLGMTPEQEEEFVGRVSPLVLDFIRANRGAIAYLQES